VADRPEALVGIGAESQSGRKARNNSSCGASYLLRILPMEKRANMRCRPQNATITIQMLIAENH
jgi:hypothetical protein